MLNFNIKDRHKKIAGIASLLLIILLAVLILRKGEGLNNDTQIDRTDTEVSQSETSSSIPSDWKEYNHPAMTLQFRYPPEWEIKTYQGGNMIQVLNRPYGWMIQVDPNEYFSYVIDNVEPSLIETKAVKPAGYTARAISHYISGTDMIKKNGDSVTEIYNIGEDVWDGTLVYTDGVGFGPGTLIDTTPGNYFAIRYWFAASNKFSNLPKQGDMELLEMLEIMDMITNSVTVE